SQLAPAFIEQYAIETSLAEKKRAEDSARLAAIKRAKNHVIGFGWGQDGVEHSTFEFQGTFDWPHFIVTAEVLSDLDITSNNGRVKLYNPSVSAWTKISIGHVIQLKDGDRVFLKALDVTDCLNFDTVLVKSLNSKQPNIRTNLKGDRAYVLAAYENDEVPSANAT
ncbi:hypothetical protein FPV67DRAFT_1389934, partial [Lyophyllum atratum]